MRVRAEYYTTWANFWNNWFKTSYLQVEPMQISIFQWIVIENVEQWMLQFFFSNDAVFYNAFLVLLSSVQALRLFILTRNRNAVRIKLLICVNNEENALMQIGVLFMKLNSYFLETL